MLSAILGRLAPYAIILALLAGAGDVLLGKALLSAQEALGEAKQAGNTRVAMQALHSTQVARAAQVQADKDTIDQLTAALNREAGAAKDHQGDLDKMTAANAALTQELQDAYSANPSAAAWGRAPLPAGLLDAPGMCWWTAGSGFGSGCAGPAGPVGQPPGG